MRGRHEGSITRLGKTERSSNLYLEKQQCICYTDCTISGPKKFGYCVKFKKEQNSICKSHKPIFYSKSYTENINC